jgi:hypothetical protein
MSRGILSSGVVVELLLLGKRVAIIFELSQELIGIDPPEGLKILSCIHGL